jgi:hypothetical protein
LHLPFLKAHTPIVPILHKPSPARVICIMHHVGWTCAARPPLVD